MHFSKSLLPQHSAGALSLSPTSYSEAQTVASIIDKLQKDPEQRCNTTAAFNGLVMEFVPYNFNPTSNDRGDAVGTLDEFYIEETKIKRTYFQQTGINLSPVNSFIIRTQGGGLIFITRLLNGNFVVETAIDENKNSLIEHYETILLPSQSPI